MNKKAKVMVSIFGTLLGVLLVLPIIVGGMGSALFWIVFWALALSITMTLLFVITTQRQPH